MTYETPDALHQAAWKILARGVADRRHPARHPTLATVGAEGPEQRSVVLRGWSDKGVAEIHTDSASAKIVQLATDPRASLHVWVPRARLQIRLSGQAHLLHGAEDRWRDVPDLARLHYGVTPTPGTRIDTPQDVSKLPDKSRFTVIEIHMTSADILYLGDDQYHRIESHVAEAGWESFWIAP